MEMKVMEKIGMLLVFFLGVLLLVLTHV